MSIRHRIALWLGLVEEPDDPGPDFTDLAAYYDRAAIEFDGVPLLPPHTAYEIGRLESVANGEDPDA